MKRIEAVLVAGLLSATLSGQGAAEEPKTNAFILKMTGEAFAIDAVQIAAGGIQAVQTSDGVIGVIFPPGPGQSAALITPEEGRMLVIRNTGEELRVEERSADGSSRELPPRSLDDLPKYDIRVSITGGGKRAAFLISQNRTVESDVGPVANMFSGRVPAETLAGGYVLQTETYRHETGAPVAGKVPLEIDRWPFARVTLPDGVEAEFIVDIGAANTVVDKSMVPSGVDITEASMVEYSAAGKRTLKYAPGGATGKVQTVVGHAALADLALAGIAVPDITVDVLEDMPDFFGRPVGGIVGMDILRRCRRLRLDLGGEDPNMEFGAAPSRSADAIELPFAFVSTHLVVEGDVNGTPVFFILDSGAPSSYLDEVAAAAAGVLGDESKADESRGLDGGGVSTLPGNMAELTLGDRLFDNVPCRISSLSAFDALRGEDQHVGLLGNDFFGRLSGIEIDFETRTVRFLL